MPHQGIKIAAVHYQDIRGSAIGLSSPGASAKFRDALTGGKAELWLTPTISADAVDLGDPRLEPGFLHRGR